MKTGIGKYIHGCAASCTAKLNSPQTKPSNVNPLALPLGWLLQSVHHLGNPRRSSQAPRKPSRLARFRLYQRRKQALKLGARSHRLVSLRLGFSLCRSSRPNKAVIVDHCALCGEWVEDQKGDRSAWNAHCKTHYKTMFSPFKHRLQGHVSSRL